MAFQDSLRLKALKINRERYRGTGGKERGRMDSARINRVKTYPPIPPHF